MSLPNLNLIIKRGISTSAVREGKRNFKKFLLYNKRGSRIFKEQQRQNPDPDIPIDSNTTLFLTLRISLISHIF